MASSETSPFYSAVSAVFKGWTALQLAVAHSFGGSHSGAKAEWFVSATEQWFKDNSDIDSFELEEFLAEIMSSEFNSVVDDNSLAEVATKICRFYDLVKQGRLEELSSKIGTLKKSADISASQRKPGDSDDDNDEMDVEEENVMSHMNALELRQTSTATREVNGDTSNSTDHGEAANEREDNSSHNSKPTEDEDGWTTVTKSSRKKRGG